MKNIGIIVLCLLGLNVALILNLSKVSGGYELHMLNVGQGDAILLVTPDEHHVLIDGGPGRSVLMELGETLPLLWKEIDLLILSHPHLDHMEGLIHVLDRFEVGAVLMSAPAYDSLYYEAFMSAVEGSDARVYFAEAGTDFCVGEWDASLKAEYEIEQNCEGLYLDVLYPFKDLTGQKMDNINNASPVIMAEFWPNMHSEATEESVRILLTGDAEEEVEEDLLLHFCANTVQNMGSTFEVADQTIHPEGEAEPCLALEADILKAGHHGSRTSSSLEFLEAVDPELLLISAGLDNQFGHPHPETLEKSASLGIEVRRSDLEGRVSLSW